MSVINKMLRDLDDRQASGTLQVRVQDGRDGIARDTQSIRDDGGPVKVRQDRKRVSPWLVLLAVIVLLVGGAAGWWYQSKRPLLVEPTVQLPAPQAPASNPVVTPAAVSSATAAKGQTKPAPGRPGADSQPSASASKVPEPAVPAASRPAIPATVARNLASLPSVAAEPSLRMDTAVRGGAGGGSSPAPSGTAQQATPPTPLPAPLPAPTPAPSLPPAGAQAARPSPVMEALAQAQALWTAGSRTNAMELLRDAISVAERSAGTGGSATLAALARELGRMELAEGRAASALEMLTRLEPSLSGVADIWALRGNAAQRLGRHEESANAYLTALKLRPGETRWMLGAAVSLAAQGQTGAAAEWAEQARAAGALSREVASYLQQLGVPLRER